MYFRKLVATITIASLFFWAPSAILVRAGIPPCGLIPAVTWITADTAFAFPAPAPCPVPGTAPHPWAVLFVGLGAFSVIVNGIIVGHTQCRELTHQEAVSSIFLPFVGIAFNQNNNKCH